MLLSLIVLIIVPLVSSEILLSDELILQQEILRLNVATEQLTKTLHTECPESAMLKVDDVGDWKTKRTLRLQLSYRMKKQTYNRLFEELVKCHQSKLTTRLKKTTTIRTTTLRTTTITQPSTTQSTTNQPITSPKTTTTTQPPTTQLVTTRLPPAIHSICKSALNLTDYWRLDHVGSDIKGAGSGYSCDDTFFKTEKTQWFRFTGAAGTRLLNKCPKVYSCGTSRGLWSRTQPVDDGKIGVVNRFHVYGSTLGWKSDTCTQWGPYDIESINCGNGDVIYKHGVTLCNAAYCGMDI